MIEMEIMGHAPTEGAIESAHIYAQALAKHSDTPRVRTQIEQSMRAVRARDPKLLLWLEKAAEAIGQQHERQRGQTRRATSNFLDSFEPQEVQMWQKAYSTADAGDPLVACAYIYTAACVYAGLIHRC
jgi:hypothetical protein